MERCAGSDWGGESHRDAFVDGDGDLTIGRDEDVGLQAEDGDDVGVADADAGVRSVEHELDVVDSRSPSGRASRDRASCS